MVLVCGNEGSTTREIVEQINDNTTDIETNNDRLDSLEDYMTPRGSLKLVTPEAEDVPVPVVQTITDEEEPVVLTIFNTKVTARGGITVSEDDNTITYVGESTDSSIISVGVNASFPGTEEMEMYLYINGEKPTGNPINIQGRGAAKPVDAFWQMDIPLTNGAVIDIRGRNADEGEFDITYLNGTFRLDID